MEITVIFLFPQNLQKYRREERPARQYFNVLSFNFFTVINVGLFDPHEQGKKRPPVKRDQWI